MFGAFAEDDIELVAAALNTAVKLARGHGLAAVTDDIESHFANAENAAVERGDVNVVARVSHGRVVDESCE